MKTQALLCLSLLAVAPLSAHEVTRELSADPVLLADQAVRVEFKVGELKIEGTDGDELEAHLTATCRKAGRSCLQRLEELRVVTVSSNGQVEVTFEGLNKWRAKRMGFEAVVRVPRTSPVDVKMGVGTLEVENLSEDLAVDMWIGDLSVRMAEADVHSVMMDAGIGDAEIHTFGDEGRHYRPLLVGKEVSWTEGSGGARVDLDLQIGGISVQLD